MSHLCRSNRTFRSEQREQRRALKGARRKGGKVSESEAEIRVLGRLM